MDCELNMMDRSRSECFQAPVATPKAGSGGGGSIALGAPRRLELLYPVRHCVESALGNIEQAKRFLVFKKRFWMHRSVPMEVMEMVKDVNEFPIFPTCSSIPSDSLDRDRLAEHHVLACPNSNAGKNRRWRRA